ncbi:hypothetical protein ACINB_30660 [Acidovorax sp. NB1]|nr:hypothetical protein ACINB_30660 [Acidovorax sp. NB1]
MPHGVEHGGDECGQERRKDGECGGVHGVKSGQAPCMLTASPPRTAPGCGRGRGSLTWVKDVFTSYGPRSMHM